MRLLFRSIRARLIVFALIATGLAIGLSGFGLTTLFGRHVERRVGYELDNYIAQLAGNVRVEANGTLSLRQPPLNPRFERPFAGLYWQIRDHKTGQLLRSRSLWDSELPVGPASLPGSSETEETEIAGGSLVLVHSKTIVITEKSEDSVVTLTVAVDKSDIFQLRSDFASDLIPGLLILAGAILTGAWVQVGLGLRPLAQVRSAVGKVRSGKAERLELSVPTEIGPLVEEVNDLLAAQQDAMQKSRDRAADLAHGLRTPLTALASDIARLRAQGQMEIADDIEAVAIQMRRTVERELARARLRHQNGRVSRVAASPIVEAIFRTLKRTPSGESITFTHSIARDFFAPMHQDDLAEVFGNLIENAARAANARLTVTASTQNGKMSMSVEDDGPGMAKAKIRNLLKRGIQSDEAGGSAGLGLAIVSDIVTAYGGSIDFTPSQLGGLSVTITFLPDVDSE